MIRSALLRGAPVCALTLAIVPFQAFAQEALPPIDVGAETPRHDGASRPADRAGDPKSYVAPVAASGTKTDTPVMETPLNVQTVTRQVLQDQQVTSIDQAIKNVSGVTILPNAAAGSAGSPNSGQITLRGFQTTSTFRNGFRNNFDGYYGSGPEFANVESVEVMKGAPAILYGIVEPGGLVNIITKRPQETPSYSVEQQVGSFAFYRTSIDATGPVTKDKSLLYRVDMSYENSGSFIDLVHASKFFIAPVVTWNITPRTQANLEFEYLKADDGQYSGIAPTYNGRLLGIPRSGNYGESDPVHIDRYLIGFDWSHEFDDDWTFKHRVQYIRKDLTALYPYATYIEDTGSSVLLHRGAHPGLKVGYDAFSTEANLTGHFNTGELQHTMLFGADLYKNTIWSSFTGATQDSVIDLLNPIHPGTPFGSSFLIGHYQEADYNYGLYLQDQIKLPFGLHLMGGVRYQNTRQLSRGVFDPINAPLDIGWSQNTTLNAQRLTPRVGVLWQPQDWFSVYGNYAEGFGPNGGTIYPQTPIPPSDARQWEFGAKAEFFGGRLRATAAYYELTKTNVPTDDLAHPGYSLITGEVRSKGPEIDIQGEILPGWNVILTYANTEARITKSNDNDVGERFYNVPRNTASFWNTYEFRQGFAKDLKIGGGLTYQDSQRAADFTGMKLREDIAPFATVDLMGAYRFKLGGTTLTAQLNITNLLDHTYYSSGTAAYSPPGPGWDLKYRTFGAPRTFKGSLRAEF
jgi:iron complex outermembrane receptor protein